jgi:uncharacterized ferritin-like protein (DUF455 family)
MVIRGVTLRRDPAREQCFAVVHLRSELRRSNDMSEVSRRETLHRNFNNEVQSLEIAAQTLVDFPDAPWELRLQLARQCWDETRHAHLCFHRFTAMGGYKGEFPIANHEWSVVCMLDSLPARLAIQNRTFESGSIDALQLGIDPFKEVGDERTAEVIDTITADEIQHVRFANQWLKRMSQEDPRVLLKVASAIAYLERVNATFAPKEGDVDIEGREYSVVRPRIPTNIADRRRADFTEAEIAEISRKKHSGAMAPEYETGGLKS